MLDMESTTNTTLMTANQLKQEVLTNMETVRTLKYGLRVADLVFGYGVMHETATAALGELVREGVLVVSGKAGRVNVYRAVQ
jgi:Fic family protein